MILVYTACILLIFRNRRRITAAGEFAGFIVTGLGGLAVNQLLLLLLVGLGELPVEPSKLATTVCVFLFNFLSRRYLIFDTIN
jgi:putative flippase GtrA